MPTDTAMTLTSIVATSAPSTRLLSDMFRLDPSSTSFIVPATILLRASDATHLGAAPAIAWLDANSVWQPLSTSTIIDPNVGDLSANLLRAGTFAIVSGAEGDLAIAFTLRGTVSGVLPGGATTVRWNTETLTLTDRDSSFAFSSTAPSGTPYALHIDTNPPGQSCSFSGGASVGVFANQDVTDIAITCVPYSYVFGGSVTGLAGGTTIMVGTPGNVVAVGNGDYALPQQMSYGMGYEVTVIAPTGQQCVFVASQSNTMVGWVSQGVVADITCAPAF